VVGWLDCAKVDILTLFFPYSLLVSWKVETGLLSCLAPIYDYLHLALYIRNK